MTKLTSNPTVSIRINADNIASVQWAIDRLNVAEKAVKLAIDAASKVPYRLRDQQLTPAKIVDNWLAANMLIY